jgi:hypothetical protein
MKKACLFTFALLFVSMTGFAAPPSPALSAAALSQILGQPVSDGACGLPQNAVAAAAKPAKPNRPNLEKALCTATAQCETGTVYCQSNVSTTACAAYDRNCPGEQGHVTCGTTTIWCPTICLPTCTSGTPRQRACCRCAETENCWDCDFCANGFHTIDACP